jgi:glycogen synthase
MVNMLPQTKKKSLIQHIAIICVAATFFISNYYHQASHYDHFLANVATIVNKKCPKMIDPETRLDAVVWWPNRTVIYRYTLINANSFVIDKQQFTDQQRRKIIARYESDERLRIFRDGGVTVKDEYLDKSGIPITEIVVGPKDFD